MHAIKQFLIVSVTALLLAGCNTTISTDKLNKAVDESDASAFNEINRMQ